MKIINNTRAYTFRVSSFVAVTKIGAPQPGSVLTLLVNGVPMVVPVGQPTPLELDLPPVSSELICLSE